jgi:hypothetical protein
MGIAESDLSSPSADVVDAGLEFRERVALRLAQFRAPVDLAATSRSQRVAEDRVPRELESRHLVLVPLFPQTIDHPAKVDIHEILTAWRAAERALGVIPEGSLEWARVHAKLVSLRASYHKLFAERCDRPPRSEVPWRVVRRPESAEGLRSSG